MAAQKGKKKIVSRNFWHFLMLNTNPKPTLSKLSTLLIVSNYAEGYL